jgi:hypothetical protein
MHMGLPCRHVARMHANMCVHKCKCMCTCICIWQRAPTVRILFFASRSWMFITLLSCVSFGQALPRRGCTVACLCCFATYSFCYWVWTFYIPLLMYAWFFAWGFIETATAQARDASAAEGIPFPEGSATGLGATFELAVYVGVGWCELPTESMCLDMLTTRRLRATRHAPRATRHAPRATRHAPRAMRHTLRTSNLKSHASRLTPHASRLTPHASRLTPYASHVLQLADGLSHALG